MLPASDDTKHRRFRAPASSRGRKRPAAAPGVDVVHSLHLGEVLGLADRAGRGRRVDPGVVDQHVEMVGRCRNGLSGRSGRFAGCNVQRHDVQGVAEARAELDQLGPARQVLACKDPPAAAQQPLAQRKAQPAVGPGHKGNLSVIHPGSLSSGDWLEPRSDFRKRVPVPAPKSPCVGSSHTTTNRRP